MPTTTWNRAARRLLIAIIVLYVVLGTLYAVFTPPWQAPDEPAHYNYVRYLAERHRFPVIKPGDYPAAYLEEIKAARFLPGMSIDPIRYEFHQPPLYYLLAVPVYSLFGGALLPLRLESVALGALLLVVICLAVRTLAPHRPGLALGTTAFAAFVPMHLAMSAAVNNDTLAELLLATILLLGLRYVTATCAPRPERRTADTRMLVLLGIATGLGLVTKSSVYVALPLIVAAIVARHVWLDADPPAAAETLRDLALFLAPALLLAAPWWLRNAIQYGGVDLLGLGRHAEVVAGQLTTAEFIARHGPARLAGDLVLTSFHSFWGQFGWMGVVLDRRLYQALAILSGVAVVGFVMWAIKSWRLRPRAAENTAFGKERGQWAAGGLLALSGLLTLASYLWYNSQFVQHQGRYLFPALLPIGLAFALGWREALRRRVAPLVALVLLMAAISLELARALPNWPLLMLAVTGAVLAALRFLPDGREPWIGLVPYLLLVPLDLVCLFLFVVPQLKP